MMPVCVPCRKFYRPEKNGQVVEEGMPQGGSVPATDPSGWSPYKLWMADRLKCPDCGHEIVTGFGKKPFAEHYMREHYEKMQAAYPERIFVPDCC